jgi:hypothetical protein
MNPPIQFSSTGFLNDFTNTFSFLSTHPSTIHQQVAQCFTNTFSYL